MAEADRPTPCGAGSGDQPRHLQSRARPLLPDPDRPTVANADAVILGPSAWARAPARVVTGGTTLDLAGRRSASRIPDHLGARVGWTGSPGHRAAVATATRARNVQRSYHEAGARRIA